MKSFDSIANKMKTEMLNYFGYMSCERCCTNNSFAWEVHHLIYRSLAPKHPNLHDKRNLIILCTPCHKWFHESIHNRDKYVKDRKLWEIFPDLIHKEAFQ